MWGNSETDNCGRTYVTGIYKALEDLDEFMNGY